MKYDWILKGLFLVLFIVSGVLLYPRKVRMIGPDQALKIAESTPEAKALLRYRNGVLADCLTRSVVKTCASHYVSCRDHAWVVQYELTSFCPVQSDGRLGLNFLIDGLTAKIISRYPEVNYFENPQYCRDSADCIPTQDHCVNFVAGPFLKTFTQKSSCQCVHGRCV